MSMLDPVTQMPDQTLVALFANRADAYAGISRLLHAGVAPQNVGYLDATDLVFGTEAGRAGLPYFKDMKTGRVLVSAEVGGPADGTNAAAMLLESNAVAVASLAMRGFHPQLHHPIRTRQRAFAA